jgi:hypothetical protein
MRINPGVDCGKTKPNKANFRKKPNISTAQEFYTTVDRNHEKKAAEVVQEALGEEPK